jgi:hypothetical protein
MVGFLKKENAEENIWTNEKEVTRVWRKLLNDKLHNLLSSPVVTGVIELGG